MPKTKKTQYISFRVTDEQLNRIETLAAESGETARDWCRLVVLEKAGRGRGMTGNERLLYEELCRVRYLVGQGLWLLANNELAPQQWENARAVVEKKGSEIADLLLAKRSPNGGVPHD